MSRERLYNEHGVVNELGNRISDAVRIGIKKVVQEVYPHQDIDIRDLESIMMFEVGSEFLERRLLEGSRRHREMRGK